MSVISESLVAATEASVITGDAAASSLAVLVRRLLLIVLVYVAGAWLGGVLRDRRELQKAPSVKKRPSTSRKRVEEDDDEQSTTIGSESESSDEDADLPGRLAAFGCEIPVSTLLAMRPMRRASEVPRSHLHAAFVPETEARPEHRRSSVKERRWEALRGENGGAARSDRGLWLEHEEPLTALAGSSDTPAKAQVSEKNAAPWHRTSPSAAPSGSLTTAAGLSGIGLRPQTGLMGGSGVSLRPNRKL